MKVIKDGHLYQLSYICDKDHDHNNPGHQFYIQYIDREGLNNYEAGVQTQEILRVLIDRTMHCDNCLRWENNDQIIYHLRMALILHEARALERKVEKGLIKPERIKIGADGHYKIEEFPDSYMTKDAKQYDVKEK
jgi:hypothetical protein